MHIRPRKLVLSEKTCGDDGGMLLNVMSMVNGLFDESEPVEIPDGIIYLRAEFRYDELRFFYSFDEKDMVWHR